MNERRFLAGMALVAGVVLLNAPLNAAVESDVVGYTTMTMEAGKWYQVGCPFVALDGEEAPLVNDVFANGFEAGDELMILDSETSHYSSSAYWIPEKGWCDLPIAAIATPISTTLPAGQAVYIHKGETPSVMTVSGKVEAKEVSFGSATSSSWAQVAPVWPVSQSVNAFKWTGLGDGDELMILNPDTQTYSNSAYWVTGKGWCDLPIAAIAKPVDTVLPVGQAAYINKKAAGKATVSAEISAK